MGRIRKRITGFATVVALSASVMVTAAAPAMAAHDCTYDYMHQNRSGATATAAKDIKYRSGPDHTECTVRGQWYRYNYLYLHCWEWGSYTSATDRRWWYARKSHTQQEGWVPNSDLENFSYRDDFPWHQECTP